jgi:single-stranded DNA-binding protein
MAIQIEFEGYVNEVKPFDWGTVYNVGHRQVIKNAAGEWETAGYDYFDVSTQKGTAEVAKDTKVRVKGTLKTKRFDKKDGSKGIALQVRAVELEALEKKPASVPEMQQVWPDLKQVPADNAPF